MPEYFADDERQQAESPKSGLIQPPPASSSLSDGIARFLLRKEQEGLATLTIANTREKYLEAFRRLTGRELE